MQRSLGAILLAHVFFNDAVVVRVVGELWSHLDPHEEDAARVLGASRWRTWRTVTDVAFHEETIAWTVEQVRRARSYFEVTPLVLRQPAGESQAGSWRVRTIQGEEIVLGNVAAPPVSGTLSKELEAKWGDIALKVSPDDLVAIYRVIKEP